MSDEITLRLSRADADAIRRAMDGGLIAWDDASEAWMHVETPTMIAALAALAAPAEGPERAATGETGYYVGVDAFGQKVRVANNVHFTDSRKRKRAAGEESGA